MVWINVDKPTKKCTIHTNPDCKYVVSKKETPYKGVNVLKRDGGWVQYHTVAEAESDLYGKFNRYNATSCC